jgi:hypothetical protein
MVQGLKSGFASVNLGCFLPIFEYKTLTITILQETIVISLLYVAYLPGKRDPSWEHFSRAPYTFQALGWYIISISLCLMVSDFIGCNAVNKS